MTKEQIITTIQQGGYIHYNENNRPTVYDYNGKPFTRCPLSLAQRIAKLDGMTKWGDRWGGSYVGAINRGKHQEYENRRYCESIADAVEEYAAGCVHECPECGKLHTIPSDAEKYRCENCGFVGDPDDYEQKSIYDYLEDCLDIEYTIASDKTYKGVSVLVTFGGPNIYINTNTGRVELFWWGETAQYSLDRDAVDAVDEWAEEMWNCL